MTALRRFRSLLTVGLLMLASTGCAVRASYRVYDPYYHDYHHWDAHEDGYYHRWASEHHEDRDFHHLDSDRQRDYWSWRHSQDH